MVDATTRNIAIEKIRRDGGTQARAELSEETIHDYAMAMLDGVELPPVEVVYDGSAYWLVDGFHRVAAAAQVGREQVLAVVLSGTRR
jgi:ParB-like chromosome segregation protein Spo0J